MSWVITLMLQVFTVEVPRFYETVGKEAVFLGAKTVELLIWWDVLGSFENDFGNEI